MPSVQGMDQVLFYSLQEYKSRCATGKVVILSMLNVQLTPSCQKLLNDKFNNFSKTTHLDVEFIQD